MTLASFDSIITAMRQSARGFVLKFSPLLISLFFLSLLIVSAPLYLSEEKSSQPVKTTERNSNNTTTPTDNDNSVKVNIDNSVKGVVDSNPNQNGTCSVTRNGVTEIVPADKVNVNESGSGDINVKVECNNSSYSTNGSGSNKTSIKNDIKVNVNSSN